jgi:glycosyltransferase involved in cell wall biosynthesis
MDKKLKVAHIITRLEMGGAQHNTLYTVRHLDRDLFDPLLICGQGEVLDDDVAVLGAPVVFIPDLVRAISPHRDWRALRSLLRVLQEEKPDVVHTHSSKAGILGRLAARLAGVPLIVHTFHGFGFHRRQWPWTRWFYTGLERMAAGITRAFVVVSWANKEEAIAKRIGRREQYRLIRSGISLDRYTTVTRRLGPLPGLPPWEGHPLITTIGPFKPQKNPRDFIRAAARVHAKWPDARFLMVGDGGLRPTLEKDIARFGLEDVVALPGWRRDIPDILARTTVFVLTSLWEGLPRSLVEAMAAGLPCVVNAVDGASEMIEDGVTGYLIPPQKYKLTAEKIIGLIENPALRARMGTSARNSLRREFDIDTMVLQLQKLYLGYFVEVGDIAVPLPLTETPAPAPVPILPGLPSTPPARPKETVPGALDGSGNTIGMRPFSSPPPPRRPDTPVPVNELESIFFGPDSPPPPPPQENK